MLARRLKYKGGSYSSSKSYKYKSSGYKSSGYKYKSYKYKYKYKLSDGVGLHVSGGGGIGGTIGGAVTGAIFALVILISFIVWCIRRNTVSYAATGVM